jgi:dihydrofolate reductase
MLKMKPLISIIVAVSENNVIGKNNTLPWHMPADMAFFKEKTSGKVVIMGRKNYDSIPPKYRPLPNRTNIVVTRNPTFQAPGCTIVHTMAEPLGAYKMAGHKGEFKDDEIFIIGGRDIYEFALVEFADKIYLTRIHADIEGDVFFPTVDWNKWKLVNQVSHKPDEKNKYAYSFLEYERVR